MNTNKAAQWLSPLAIAASLVVEPILLAGCLITAKTGQPPIGWQWNIVPGIGMGIVGIITQQLVLFIAVTCVMHWFIRTLLLVMWSSTFLTFCTVIPVYMEASARGEGLPDTFKWILNSGTIGVLTMSYHTALVMATQIGGPALLIALRYLNVDRVGNGSSGSVTTVDDNVTKQEDVTLKDNVLSAIAKYGIIGASIKDICKDANVSKGSCKITLNALAVEGKIGNYTRGRVVLYAAEDPQHVDYGKGEK